MTVSGVSNQETKGADAEVEAHLTVDGGVLCIVHARRGRASGGILDGGSYKLVRHDCKVGVGMVRLRRGDRFFRGSCCRSCR
jgi:hypothetical protein